MTHPRTIALGIGICAIIAVVACGNGIPEGEGGGGGPSCSSVGSAGGNLGTATVKIAGTDNQVFDPAVQNAHVGDIIEWTNPGTILHNITFDVGTSYPCLTDPQFQPGDVWQVKFTKAGTYPYECTIHATTMQGKLVVT